MVCGIPLAEQSIILLRLPWKALTRLSLESLQGSLRVSFFVFRVYISLAERVGVYGISFGAWRLIGSLTYVSAL